MPGFTGWWMSAWSLHGRRLNWQLHFGEPPKWAAGVKFILVDTGASERDARKAALVLRGDAAAVAEQLGEQLPRAISRVRFAEWAGGLKAQVGGRECVLHGCRMAVLHFLCTTTLEMSTQTLVLGLMCHVFLIAVVINPPEQWLWRGTAKPQMG